MSEPAFEDLLARPYATPELRYVDRSEITKSHDMSITMTRRYLQQRWQWRDATTDEIVSEWLDVPLASE